MDVVKLHKVPDARPPQYQTPDGYTATRIGMGWAIRTPDGAPLRSAANLDAARDRIREHREQQGGADA